MNMHTTNGIVTAAAPPNIKANARMALSPRRQASTMINSPRTAKNGVMLYLMSSVAAAQAPTTSEVRRRCVPSATSSDVVSVSAIATNIMLKSSHRVS